MMDKCNAALERHERAAHARLSARGCQGHVEEKPWLRVNTALVWCEEKSLKQKGAGSEVPTPPPYTDCNTQCNTPSLV